MSDAPCQFTLQHYRAILESALAGGYRLLRLCDHSPEVVGSKRLYLRHDIDFFIEPAVRMAEVERDLGVFSSYCILLHSPTYNVGEPATLQAIKQIAGMGHEIALHYDVKYFEEAGIPADQGIISEAGYLGAMIKNPIRSIAQHRPHAYGMFRGAGGERYIDAYSDALMKEIRYISDSRRKWRDGCVHQYLGSTPAIQLLVHPEWWVEHGPSSARAIIEPLLDARLKSMEATIEEYLSSIEV